MIEMWKLYSGCKEVIHKQIDSLITIYKAHCCAVILYGAGEWGFCDSTCRQTAENHFLRGLLAVPSSLPIILCQKELDLIPLMQLVKIAQIMLWHSVWAEEEPVLNRAIISLSRP